MLCHFVPAAGPLQFVVMHFGILLWLSCVALAGYVRATEVRGPSLRGIPAFCQGTGINILRFSKEHGFLRNFNVNTSVVSVINLKYS